MTASHGPKPRLMQARDWMHESRSVGQGRGYMANLTSDQVDGWDVNENFANGTGHG